MKILLVVFLLMFLSGCGPKESEQEKEYKDKVYQEDAVEMQEYDVLTENPNAIYY